MLVPLVLRSIVLPYLRSTTLATTSSTTAASRAVAVSGTARAVSTSTSYSSPVEAVLRVPEQDGAGALRRTGWRVNAIDVSAVAPRHPNPPHLQRPPPTTLDTPVHERPHPKRERRDKAAENASPTPSISTPHPNVAIKDEFNKYPGPPVVDLPPAIDKLLEAKLYRLTVFHILNTPEYVANLDLIEYVIGRLEKKGAGKLARRLRLTIDEWKDPSSDMRHDEQPRLLSERREAATKTRRRPPTYWRLPAIPRDPTEYRGTAQERRTHYINHRITSYLTVQHPAPYKTWPLPREPLWPRPPAPKLSRVQDVLRMIDKLRVSKNFVPDRVTANIVVKAWLMSLSMRKDWAKLPLAVRKRDLRDIFGLLASSIEQGNQPGLLNPPAGSDPSHMAFDPTVEYRKHVKPLSLTIIKAMMQVGDHDGRRMVERWDKEMKAKLAKEHPGAKGLLEEEPETEQERE